MGHISRARLQQLAEHFDKTDAAELSWSPAEDAVVERPELEQVSICLPKEDLAELGRHASTCGIR